MPVYFFVDIKEVSDPETFGEYRAKVLASVERHGGVYRILGGPVEVMEGSWPIGTPVLLEFPSRAAFESWYRSDEYAPLLKMRLDAADCAALLIEGCAHPPD